MVIFSTIDIFVIGYVKCEDCYARPFGEIGSRQCRSELFENKCGIVRPASVDVPQVRYNSLNSLNIVQRVGTQLRSERWPSSLPNNKTRSLKCLASLVQHLKQNGKLQDYDAIMQPELEGIIEEAKEPTQVKEYYIPHKAVIRES